MKIKNPTFWLVCKCRVWQKTTAVWHLEWDGGVLWYGDKRKDWWKDGTKWRTIQEKKMLEAPKYFKLGWKFTFKQDNNPKHTARVTMVGHQTRSSVWMAQSIFLGEKVKVIFSDYIVLYVHVCFCLSSCRWRSRLLVYSCFTLSPHLPLFLFHLSFEIEINFIYSNREAGGWADHFGSKPICLIPSKLKLDALQSLTVLKIFLQMEKSHTTVPTRGNISYLWKLHTHAHKLQTFVFWEIPHIILWKSHSFYFLTWKRLGWKPVDWTTMAICVKQDDLCEYNKTQILLTQNKLY